MNCLQCGSEMEADSRFCGICGAPAPSGPQLPPPLPAQATVPLPASETAPLPPQAAAPLPAPPAVGVTAPMPPAYSPPQGPPPLPAPGSVVMPSGPAPAVGGRASAGLPTGAIVAIVAAAVLFFGVLGVGGYFAAKQFGLLGAGSGSGVVRTTPSSGDSSVETTALASEDNSAAPTVTPPPATSTPLPPPVAGVAPAGRVLDLKDRPTDPAKARLRQELLDAARKRLRTKSRFFVNQLWVDGDWAIGELGAEKRGHRMWFVWRGTPRRVVWTGNWGVTDELSLKRHVGAVPPELLARINWTKRWPKEFKFVR